MAKKMLSLLTILLLVLLALTAIIRWQASVTFSKLEAGEHSLRARWETLTALDARLDTYCKAACWLYPLLCLICALCDRTLLGLWIGLSVTAIVGGFVLFLLVSLLTGGRVGWLDMAYRVGVYDLNMLQSLALCLITFYLTDRFKKA